MIRNWRAACRKPKQNKRIAIKSSKELGYSLLCYLAIRTVFLSIFQLFAVSSKEGEGFPGGSDGKESAYNTGDQGSIPGSGRSPGKVNDNALHYSCLENPMDRRASGVQHMGLQRVRHDQVT